MEETKVYLRDTGMHYNVQSMRVTKNEFGQATIVPGIEVFFAPRSLTDQRAEFDPMKYAREYVKNDAVSGRISVMDDEAQDKRVQDIYNLLCRFIERHEDYGVVIHPKPTKAEIARQLQFQKDILEKQISELTGKIEDPMTIDVDKDDLTPKEVNPLVKGGGVVQGGSLKTARG